MRHLGRFGIVLLVLCPAAFACLLKIPHCR